MNPLLLILAGGLGLPPAVFLTARALVHRHGDPAAASAYLDWFRAEQAAERAAAPVPAQTRTSASARPKELTR
ncbi:hypothetical protein [Micromonospora sp. RTGN7]|uniref:hypothetical protein n=1 Tax=Micromonospora sp. RTGN7 TaxID=3016526 RepID=UPI0029FF1020|nr:hypothetical protein [Micromonospora sp. RTGN7]